MIIRFLLALLVTAPLVASAQTLTWPQWRGPTRDGVVPGAGMAWPAKLSEELLKTSWHVDLSTGYSSPIVAPDRVFVVESIDKQEVVRALDRATGKELWQLKWDGYMNVPFFALKNGNWVRCTPAYDGKHLYVGGMRDVLVCIDAADGKEVWRVDFTKRFGTPVPDFGFVSSPLLVGEFLYVQAGGGVVKLKKATGETVWRALDDGGGMMGSAFSSPMLAKIGGVDQLVVQTRTNLAGVDDRSGKVLWSVNIPSMRGMSIINPVVAGDQVFMTSYGGGSFMFDIAREGETWSARELWKTKLQGYMGTPVVIKGHIYLHGRDQKMHCIDWKTGQEKWASPEKFGEYVSLVVNGEQVLALDQRGVLMLLRASAEKFDIIDRRNISSQDTWAHVTVCGEEIWIRELKGITRWVWSQGK